MPSQLSPQCGQQADFANAFAMGWDRFVRQAEARLGSPSDAEDAVSNAFMHAYERRHTYDHRRALLTTWLATIVRNEIIDRLRRHTRDRTETLEAAVLIEAGEDIEALALEHERQEWLVRGMARLPERDRLVITLRFMRGLTNREIAHELDANERTVSVWLLRAARQLKRILEEDPQ